MPTPPRKATKKKAGSRRVARSRPTTRITAVRKKKTARIKVETPATGNLPKLRVRMYRQGLGDCFLLTFNPGGDEKHVLVDCGTLGVTEGVKMSDVIADVDSTTNGHLHLVIATHEHQDHLSGFSRLSDQFSPVKNKQIDHVWLAWTEDPKDKLAKQLGKVRDDMGIAVKAAAKALRATGGDRDTVSAIDSLLGFFGETLGASGTAD